MALPDPKHKIDWTKTIVEALKHGFIERNQARDLLATMGGAHSPPHAPPPPPHFPNGSGGAGGLAGMANAQFKPAEHDPFSQHNMLRAIHMRLRTVIGAMLPFKFFECHHNPTMGKVFVFVVRDDASDPVVLEDTEDLFPSDQLITQLRVIMPK